MFPIKEQNESSNYQFFLLKDLPSVLMIRLLFPYLCKCITKKPSAFRVRVLCRTRRVLVIPVTAVLPAKQNVRRSVPAGKRAQCALEFNIIFVTGCSVLPVCF